MNREHRHSWESASRHRTSEGMLHYQRCACGRWRMALLPFTSEVLTLEV
ncbi:hypothetical protein [Rhodococcus triatomae]|nr:hypothetical protein [Rhodococcus triatomae]